MIAATSDGVYLKMLVGILAFGKELTDRERTFSRDEAIEMNRKV